MLELNGDLQPDSKIVRAETYQTLLDADAIIERARKAGG